MTVFCMHEYFHNSLNFFFAKGRQIYYKYPSEVPNTSIIIKIALRSMDHPTTTVVKKSHRCAEVAAPVAELTWPYRWQLESLHRCAPKDQHPGSAVIAAESLIRLEESDTKSRSRARTTKNPIPVAPRSWQESMPEIRLIRPDWRIWVGSKLEDWLEEEEAPSVRVLPFRGLKS